MCAQLAGLSEEIWLHIILPFCGKNILAWRTTCHLLNTYIDRIIIYHPEYLTELQLNRFLRKEFLDKKELSDEDFNNLTIILSKNIPKSLKAAIENQINRYVCWKFIAKNNINTTGDIQTIQSKNLPEHCKQLIGIFLEIQKFIENNNPKNTLSLSNKLNTLFEKQSHLAISWLAFVAAKLESYQKNINILKKDACEFVFDNCWEIYKSTIINDACPNPLSIQVAFSIFGEKKYLEIIQQNIIFANTPEQKNSIQAIGALSLYFSPEKAKKFFKPLYIHLSKNENNYLRTVIVQTMRDLSNRLSIEYAKDIFDTQLTTVENLTASNTAALTFATCKTIEILGWRFSYEKKAEKTIDSLFNILLSNFTNFVLLDEQYAGIAIIQAMPVLAHLAPKKAMEVFNTLYDNLLKNDTLLNNDHNHLSSKLAKATCKTIATLYLLLSTEDKKTVFDTLFETALRNKNLAVSDAIACIISDISSHLDSKKAKEIFEQLNVALKKEKDPNRQQGTIFPMMLNLSDRLSEKDRKEIENILNAELNTLSKPDKNDNNEDTATEETKPNVFNIMLQFIVFSKNKKNKALYKAVKPIVVIFLLLQLKSSNPSKNQNLQNLYKLCSSILDITNSTKLQQEKITSLEDFINELKAKEENNTLLNLKLNLPNYFLVFFTTQKTVSFEKQLNSLIKELKKASSNSPKFPSCNVM